MQKLSLRVFQYRGTTIGWLHLLSIDENSKRCLARRFVRNALLVTSTGLTVTPISFLSAEFLFMMNKIRQKNLTRDCV